MTQVFDVTLPRKTRAQGTQAYWSQTEIALMVSLKLQGWSASDIGGELGRTRNSVIGKLHRCGVDQVWLHEQRTRLKLEVMTVPEMPPKIEIVNGECPHRAQWQPKRTQCAKCISRSIPKKQRGWTGLGGLGMSSLG